MYVLAFGQISWANRRPRLFTDPAVAGAVPERQPIPLALLYRRGRLYAQDLHQTEDTSVRV
jgi:hypothetical protein